MISKIDMTILRSNGMKNKLEVYDNRPFAVVRMDLRRTGGLELEMYDLTSGKVSNLVYRNTEDILKEWNVFDYINVSDRVYFKGENGYMD